MVGGPTEPVRRQALTSDIVTVTGSLPTGIQDFIAGTAQWYLRAQAWFYGLTDEYPPFGFEIQPSA